MRQAVLFFICWHFSVRTSGEQLKCSENQWQSNFGGLVECEFKILCNDLCRLFAFIYLRFYSANVTSIAFYLIDFAYCTCTLYSVHVCISHFAAWHERIASWYVLNLHRALLHNIKCVCIEFELNPCKMKIHSFSNWNGTKTEWKAKKRTKLIESSKHTPLYKYMDTTRISPEWAFAVGSARAPKINKLKIMTMNRFAATHSHSQRRSAQMEKSHQ